METLLQDLRYAARTLLKNPGFTVVAVLTLALGIGANTAIFSVVDGVLLRPAPFQDMDRLMVVWETDRNSGTTREPASLPDYIDYKDQSETFETLAGFSTGTTTLSGTAGVPLQLPQITSTHEFLPMTGIAPMLGRTFTMEEIRPDGGNVVLIAEGLWERLYARNPDVLGQTIRLDGNEYRIAGNVGDRRGPRGGIRRE